MFSTKSSLTFLCYSSNLKMPSRSDQTASQQAASTLISLALFTIYFFLVFFYGFGEPLIAGASPFIREGLKRCLLEAVKVDEQDFRVEF